MRAELADVASIELVTERTVRFVLKRPSDFALRALCDVPILPDHLMRGVRLESSPIARQPVGTGPFRFAGWERGKRIRLERSPEAWGPAPGVDEIVFDLDPDAVRALNRTRRGEIDVLPRVLDVHYPDQVEPTTLHGATTLFRLTVAPLFVPGRQPPALPAGRPAVPPRDGRALGSRPLRRRAAQRARASRSAGRRSAATSRRAAVRSRRAPSPRSRTPATATATPTACAITWGTPIRLTLLEPAGNRLFNVEAHAFVLEMRKAGILVDLVPADAGDHPWRASSAASSISRR